MRGDLMSRKNSNATKGGNQNTQNRKKNNQANGEQRSGKKNRQVDRSDLKQTRCSECRFNRKGDPCYQKKHLLSEQEYVDCIPAFVHYSEKRLSSMGLI
jgi:hypothetical protein